MSERENPATVFIARNVGERVTGIAWAQMSDDMRARWMACASDLVVNMYAAGFRIPQPADPDAVWAELKRAAA